MEWTRRDFLAGAGAATAAVLAPGAAVQAEEDQSSDDDPASFDPTDWTSVRNQFPLTRRLRHFAAFTLASHPKPVGRAISHYRRALDESTEAALNELALLEGAGREAAARYLGASAEDIALTDSTTMGLGLLYSSLRLAPGDEVVTTEHDFYSTHVALHLRSLRDGVAVRRVGLYDDAAAASVDEIVSRFVAGMTPATRIAAVTWVHSSTGVKLPIGAMAEALADVNRGRDPADHVLLCVDGVHGLGIEDATVDELGCDFLISGTHKWLFGPRGTGLVWGRPSAWARTTPVIPPFDGPAFESWINGDPFPTERPGPLATPGGYHSFEHRWALAKAFEFHEAIGKAAIAERTHVQATALKEGLASIPGVTVVTPMDPALSAGIVCVDVADRFPFELLQLLHDDHAIVASIAPYATPYLRFGPSIVTSPREVDRVVEAVAANV